MGKVAAKHRGVKRFIFPLIGAVLASFATGCQTTSNIAPHFEGTPGKRLASASQVQTRKIPTSDLKAHSKNMARQGYVLVGKAMFQGEQQGDQQLKGFSASVGADLAEGYIVPVGTSQRSYMGISSYTPGRTATTFGASSAYATGSSSGTINSPYGAIPFNSSGSATAYGTSATSTYIPSQTTYAPMSYDVLITQQMYLFWASPNQTLREWKNIAKMVNAGKPPEQQISPEETKRRAAIFAQAWGLRLPANLRPKEQVPQMSESQLAEARSFTVKALE